MPYSLRHLVGCAHEESLVVTANSVDIRAFVHLTVYIEMAALARYVTVKTVVKGPSKLTSELSPSSAHCPRRYITLSTTTIATMPQSYRNALSSLRYLLMDSERAGSQRDRMILMGVVPTQR